MFSVIQFLYAVIIGLVQAISEWLPISSKTQVLLASAYLFHLTYSEAYAFGLFMEIGTTFAAVIYFRKEIVSLIRVLILKGTENEKRLFTYVLTATIMTGIIGAPLYIFADSLTSVPLGIPMIIIGLVLIGDALLIRHSRIKQREGANTRTFKDMGIKDYLIIGIVQGIAALPGVSRSGITTSAMLLMKIEPDEAFRLSFLIGIFAAIAAFGLTLVASHQDINAALSSISLAGLAVAIVVSAIVSLFIIDFLIKIAGRSRIVYLAAALGIIAIASGAILTFAPSVAAIGT
jgi:undecaprenyl-diphosphatase